MTHEQDIKLASLAISSTFYSAVSKVLRHGTLFFTHIILMNLLQPSDFGLMKYVTVILGILSMVNESGLNIAIIQKRSLSIEQLPSVNLIHYCECILLYTITFLSAPILASVYQNSQLTLLIRVGALAFLCNALTLVSRSQLQRSLRYKKLAIIEILSSFLSMVCAIYSAKHGFGVWSLVIGLIAFNFFQSLFLFISSPWPGLSFLNIKGALPVILFALGIAGQRIIGFLSLNSDYMIIGKFFGEEILGYYSIAYVLISAPFVIFGVITGNVIYSYFSRIQDNSNVFVKSYLLLSQVFMSGSFIFLGLVAVLAQELMQTVTFLQASPKWLPAVPYIYFLLPLGFIYTMYSFPDLIWIVKKKIKLSLVMGVVGLVTVILAVIIGSHWGMKGVCIALAVKAILILPLILYLNKIVFGCPVRDYITIIFPPLLCLLLTMGLLFVLKLYLINRMPPILLVVAVSVTGITLYPSMYYLLFQKNFTSLLTTLMKFAPRLT